MNSPTPLCVRSKMPCWRKHFVPNHTMLVYMCVQEGVRNIQKQCFSSSTVHWNHLSILLKCRVLIFNKHSGDAEVATAQTHLVARS